MAKRAYMDWRWAARILVPLVIFSAALSLVALLVFNPLLLALAQFLIAFDGTPFAGNFDLLPFLSTIPGMLTVILIAASAIFLFAVRFGGLLLIAWSGRKSTASSLGRVSVTLARRLPQLLLLSGFGFAVALLLAAPVGAAALFAKWFWLSGGDIYFYVSTRPPEFFHAIFFTGAVASVCLVLAAGAVLRWIMALAYCAIGGRPAAKALRLSAEGVKGRRGVLLLRLAVALAAILGLSIILSTVLTLVFDAMFWPGQPLRTSSRLLLIFAVLATVSAAFVSALGHALVAMICTEQYAAMKGPAGKMEAGAAARGTRKWAVWAACLVLPLIAAGQTLWTLEKFDTDQRVLVTAHRAGSRAAPENTLAALERAIEAGADYAEIDVQETRDGELIVFHDTDFRRIAGLARPVWELDLTEVEQLDAGAWFAASFAGERIPTLRVFAERARGRIGLNVEIKDNRHGQDLARRTLAVLNETGVLDSSVITSLSLPLLADVRAADPNISIGYIASTGIGNMLALDVDFYSLAARIATTRFITQAREKGRGTHVWGVDTQSAFMQAILDGAQNLITDEPVQALAVAREMEDMTQAELTLLNLRRRFERAGLVGGGR